MRVLIAFGTSRGGTAGLAAMVAEALQRHDVEIEIVDAKDVDPGEDFDGIIVGGALYNNRWHPDATWFVERNLAALRATNVWFFSSGPLDDSASGGALAPIPHIQELARVAEIHGHMTFGGVLEPTKGRFVSRFVTWGRPGDFRDPRQVAEWVERIVPRLAEPRRTVVLPDAVEDRQGRLTRRVLRKLTEAGDHDSQDSDDQGLDVLFQ